MVATAAPGAIRMSDRTVPIGWEFPRRAARAGGGDAQS
jgi:hypothetical protein